MNNTTALNMAAQRGHIAVVKLLLAADANPDLDERGLGCLLINC